MLRSSTFGSDSTEADDCRATTCCGSLRWIFLSGEGHFGDIARTTRIVHLAEGDSAARMPRRCRNAASLLDPALIVDRSYCASLTVGRYRAGVVDYVRVPCVDMRSKLARNAARATLLYKQAQRGFGGAGLSLSSRSGAI